MKEVFAILVVIMIGTICLAYQRSQISFVNTYCPLCGGVEILDCGEDNGNQLCHCFDCDKDFTIIQNGEKF